MIIMVNLIISVVVIIIVLGFIEFLMAMDEMDKSERIWIRIIGIIIFISLWLIDNMPG